MEILFEYIIITMFITFMILYVSAPKKFVVYKEPNVNTTKSDLYVDDNKTCYRYIRKEIPCPE